MRKLSLLLCVLFVVGCASTKPMVLLETEAYYLIPAGTTFRAVAVDGGPVIEVQRTHDSYAVDAGMLIKLQEEANACTIQ